MNNTGYGTIRALPAASSAFMDNILGWHGLLQPYLMRKFCSAFESDRTEWPSWRVIGENYDCGR